MDLNIRIKSSSGNRERSLLYKRLVEFGWEGIAWNQIVLANAQQRNAVKPLEPIVLSTMEIQEVMKSRAIVTNESLYSPIHQYNRITIVVDDIADAQNITANNEHLRKFDIVAVLPGNAKALAHACKNCDIDLICFDFTRKIPFQVSKKMIDTAIDRGILFEIIYGPVFYSAVSRREVFNNSQYLITMLRRRNLILSRGSGTDDAVNLRGRFEGMNVGLLMQLSAEESRKATRDSCLKVIQHGILRKNRFLPVEIFSNETTLLKSLTAQQIVEEDSSKFNDVFEENRISQKKRNKRKRSQSINEEEHEG